MYTYSVRVCNIIIGIIMYACILGSVCIVSIQGHGMYKDISVAVIFETKQDIRDRKSVV